MKVYLAVQGNIDEHMVNITPLKNMFWSWLNIAPFLLKSLAQD